MSESAPYGIGIDLGTTNCAVAYVDRRRGGRVELFAVAQLVAPGELDRRALLPSCIYFPTPHEDLFGAARAPGGRRADVVGELARRQGSRVAGRLVLSSKSWLSHERVDRTAAILPWQGAPDCPRISPVAAATRLLEHIRDAWDEVMATGDARAAFTAQPVVITVPASFDQVARSLTLEAARAAGIASPQLIEEPQAALYAWIGAHADELGQRLAPGASVLVVDVGGGTTDLTVVTVEGSEGDLVLRRVAVSEHLLLGGDNVDVAIARLVLPRLEAAGGALEARDWPLLQLLCREAKETLLQPEAPERTSVVLPGRGSRLLGGARMASLEREEVVQLVLEGFLPRVPLEQARPERSRAGLQELGLPYAADPAITRHIGGFLQRHAPEGERVLAPTAVLFNGGMVKQEIVRARILDAIEDWTGQRPVELVSAGYDLAVARGAAYYGMVRRGEGIRIRGGIERAYYVGVDVGKPRPAALCVAPRGLEAGQTVEVPLEVRLKTNMPVAFPLYASTSRDDRPGELVAAPRLEGEDADMHELPPLVTMLRTKRRRASRAREIPVEVTARLSELGVLELGLHATDGSGRRWALEQTVRLATVGDDEQRAQRCDPEALERALAAVHEAFDAPPGPASPLRSLGARLEEIFAAAREAWPVGVCRALFDRLLPLAELRERSPEHEARWLNLVGLCIRPGYGALLDEHRIAGLWRVVLSGLRHPEAAACRIEWWILLRRAAGGLGRGQQEQVLGKLQGALFGRGRRREHAQELAEMWRLAASLERLARGTKVRLGERLLETIEAGRGSARWSEWSLGRLGERTPVFGPLNEVVPPETVERWIERLLRHRDRHPVEGDALVRTRFALVQMARRTGDPARDVSEPVRERVLRWLEAHGASEAQRLPVEQIVPPAAPEQRLRFGDSLPTGLRLAPT
ncbi:MAG: molecular chaperone DnaK [Planctomycetota bacterium]|nr:MAG: molecular chaperone DnaK [Planctomycetota bacterium]